MRKEKGGRSDFKLSFGVLGGGIKRVSKYRNKKPKEGEKKEEREISEESDDDAVKVYDK